MPYHFLQVSLPEEVLQQRFGGAAQPQEQPQEQQVIKEVTERVVLHQARPLSEAPAAVEIQDKQTVGVDDPPSVDPSSLWYLHGRAYDLSDFINQHPGAGPGAAPKPRYMLRKPRGCVDASVMACLWRLLVQVVGMRCCGRRAGTARPCSSHTTRSLTGPLSCSPPSRRSVLTWRAVTLLAGPHACSGRQGLKKPSRLYRGLESLLTALAWP